MNMLFTRFVYTFFHEEFKIIHFFHLPLVE